MFKYVYDTTRNTINTTTIKFEEKQEEDTKIKKCPTRDRNSTNKPQVFESPKKQQKNF